MLDIAATFRWVILQVDARGMTYAWPSHGYLHIGQVRMSGSDQHRVHALSYTDVSNSQYYVDGTVNYNQSVISSCFLPEWLAVYSVEWKNRPASQLFYVFPPHQQRGTICSNGAS